jgi:hypothetical protein
VVPDRAPMDYPTLMRTADLIEDGLGDGAVDSDPGVVHQDVQATVLVDDLANHATAVIGQADVALVQRCCGCSSDMAVWNFSVPSFRRR